MKSILQNLILLSFVFVLCLASVGGTSQDFQFTFAQDKDGNIIEQGQTDNVEKVIREKPKAFPNPKMAQDYFRQKKANPDTIGWLLIPNICYYPIMYNNSNKFYLNHDNFKRYSPPGAIFMNRFSKGNFNNMALIHGHRMLDGTMFGSMASFEEEKFFKNNKPIEIFEGNKIMYYKPYTVFLYKDGVQYINQDKQKDKEKRRRYFKKLASISKVKRVKDLNIDYDADMVFFQTCDYDFNDARLIVGAYKIGEVPYKQKDTYKKYTNSKDEINNIFENQYFDD